MVKILKLLKRFQNPWSKVILCLFLGAFYNLTALALPEVLRRGLNAVSEKDISALWYTAIFAAITTALYIALSTAIKLLRKNINNTYEEFLQVEILDKLISIKKMRLAQMKSGDIITHSINNVMNGVEKSLDALFDLYDGLMIIVIGCVYMWVIQWKIALIIIVYNIAMRIIMKLLEKKVKENSAKSVQILKTNNSFLLNLLSNMMIIRVFNKNSWFNQKLIEHEKNTVHINSVGNAWRNGMQDGMWAAIKMAEYLILYGFGGYMVYTGQTVIGTLLAFTMALDVLAKGISSFIFSLTAKNQAIANISGLEEILNTKEIESEQHIQITQPKPIIVFNNVSFSFNERAILSNISFNIAQNEKILITGPNGQGKSTLLNLIAGLYRPNSGEILYSEQDISLVNLEEIAKKYSYISQNSNILNGYIFQNITLSTEYEEIKCQDILNKLNLIKDTNADPQSFSQGEKQRLNIGRTLYRLNDVSMILGDEIFANIDQENASHINSILKEYSKDKTVIIVSHEDIDFPFDRVFHVEKQSVTISDWKGATQ